MKRDFEEAVLFNPIFPLRLTYMTELTGVRNLSRMHSYNTIETSIAYIVFHLSELFPIMVRNLFRNLKDNKL